MIVTIAGQSGAGKTTVAHDMIARLGGDAVLLSMDDFYFGKGQKPRIDGWGDTPAYCDVSRLVGAVHDLARGLPTTVPIFSPLVEDRIGEQIIFPKKHIVIEGLWALTFPSLREIADTKVFIEAPYEHRLERRVIRDVARGRNGKETEAIAPIIESHGTRFIDPYKVYADIVIPNR